MRTLSVLSLFVLLACSGSTPVTEADLDQIDLPPGFEISLYSNAVPGARSMVLTPGGTLFVSTRQNNGPVYAVVDRDGDYQADEVVTIAENLNTPNGVAFRDGSLYVAEIDRILRYDDIENRLGNPPEPVVVYDDLPSDRWHGWKYIAFGPDGKLYVPVGAPCNVCDREYPYSSLLRMNADGSEVETFAYGIRNTVGFTWHPVTGELWFTDNGRDNMGRSMAQAGLIPDDQAIAYTDENPGCELNRAPEAGMHFGFPYIHEDDLSDPEFGEGHDPADYTAPVQVLGPHTAPLGLAFYTGNAFPADYRSALFVAEHGSWNRTEKIGYRVMVAMLNEAGTEVTRYEPFATGWLQGEESWGRPVDVKMLPDGSMLVSDDQGGAIYRITYTGS